jgi:hypothetical protein
MLATNATSQLSSAMDKVSTKEDIYYYNSKTLKKQEIPVIYRTNFIQALSSKGGGQSVITISPDANIGSIIMGLELPPSRATFGSGSYVSLALARGWLYDAIDYVQFRYGSSSLFQKSGQQLLVEAMMTASNPTEAQKIVELAGSELKINSDFAGDKLYAYGVIPLPHASAQSGVETPNGFPTELLQSPIVITINLKPLPQLLKVGTLDATPSNNGVPSAFPDYADAYLQVRQFQPIDRGQLMKPSDGAYLYPTVFFQQVNSVQLASTPDSQEVILTGFRSGSCKGIVAWLVDTSDTANPNNFILPRDVVLSYAGNVIHNFKGVSSQALQIYYDDIPAYLENSILAPATSPAAGFTSSPKTNSWVHLPFSQRFEQLSAEYTSVAGLSIANGVMNLSLKTPTASSSYRLFYVPYYECAMVLGGPAGAGNCEYMF